MKKHAWAICFTAALIAFTVYLALDTFVLARSYSKNAVEMNTAMFADEETSDAWPPAAAATPVPTAAPAQDAAQDATQEPAADRGASEEPAASEEPSRSDSRSSRSDSSSGSSRWGGGNGSDTENDASEEPSRPDSGSGSRSDSSSDRSSRSSRSGSSRSNSSSVWSWFGGWGNDDGWSWWGGDDDPSRWGGNDDDDPDSRGSRRSDSSSRWGYSNNAESAAGVDAAAEYTGDMTYADDNVMISLTEYREYDSTIYVADVTVRSAQYIKTAFANDTYGKNVTESTSAMAVAHDAIFAVNGDYYGAQERGFVIRNGIVYRSSAADKDVMCIYADGTMGIVSDRSTTAEQLVENGVWQAFSFGPALVEDGAVVVGKRDEVGREMTNNPRTAVGMIDANHYIFVVSDGRTDESEGLSLYELATFMQGLGVKTAYNLDGGGSSTMYFNGQVVNNPTSWGSNIKERGVSDIVYIG